VPVNGVGERLRLAVQPFKIRASRFTLPPGKAGKAAAHEIGLQAIGGQFSVGIVNVLVHEGSGQRQERQR
jgi:hypothetical protein